MCQLACASGALFDDVTFAAELQWTNKQDDFLEPAVLGWQSRFWLFPLLFAEMGHTH